MALYDCEERAGAVRTTSTILGHRRIGSAWRVAVAATKRGLFGLPQTPTDNVLSEGMDESRCSLSTFKMVHKCASSPSFDPSARARSLYTKGEAIPPCPTLPFASTSSPRPRTLTSVARPVISSPSAPRHLNGAATLNSKLSYPVMSPQQPSISSPLAHPTPRRRTTSAPGIKCTKKSVIPTMDLLNSPNEFGVELPSPIWHSQDYPTTLTSPSQSSPRSVSSVKRKPVPRHAIKDEQDALGDVYLFQRRQIEGRSEVPPRTSSLASPTCTPEDAPSSRFKCPETPSQCTTSQNVHALSPLTVDEMDAIHTFLEENKGSCDTRRRRRREPRARRLLSDSYHMHTAIVDSYFDGSDEDVRPSSDMSISDEVASISSSRDNSLLDCAHVGREGGEIAHSEQLDGSVPSSPLRVNRATFGLYDTPLHSPTSKNANQDASGLKDVVEDVDDMIESFRQSVSSWEYLDREEDVPDLGRIARRGGVHAKDDNLVSHLVKSARPALAQRSYPETMEYLFDERAPSPQFEARSFRKDDDTSYSTPEIGVAIMSREDIARFESENADLHLVSVFSSSSESDHCDVEEDDDGSDDCHVPAPLSCEALVSPLTDDMPMAPDFELGDLSTSYDRLQSSLSKLRASHSPSRELGSSTSSSKLSLKPALRINSGFHSISTASSPSPPTPCSSLPPHSPAFMPSDWVAASSSCSRGSMSPRSPTFSTFPSTGAKVFHAHGKGGVSYHHYGTPPIPSFMHLTPNEPASTKQRSRGRLRQLFSRSSAKK